MLNDALNVDSTGIGVRTGSLFKENLLLVKDLSIVLSVRLLVRLRNIHGWWRQWLLLLSYYLTQYFLTELLLLRVLA